MKFVRITENDPKYIQNFTSFLIQLGAKPIDSDPLAFEVSDDFDPSYHGLEVSDTLKPVESRNAEKSWLEKYNGNFPFYLDLRRQLAQRGTLSPKQWDSISKAIARDAQYSSNKTAATKKEYSIKAGDIIVVGKWIAKTIGEKAGYARGHHTLEVIECEAETPKAYKLKVKLSAQRTNYCGVCGLTLSNPVSVQAGIGPICASRSEVSLSENSLEELSLKLSNTIVVSTWIPKRSIRDKNGIKQTHEEFYD